MGVQDAYQSEEETNSSLRAESSGSRESIHYSCEDIDAPEDEYVLTKNQKHTFFRILKRLLEDSGSLKDGKEGRERQSGKILKLMYMTHRCEINILDSARHRLYREIVPTQDIYLKWCGDEYAEPLHMENLKEVHNELRFLRILKEKVDACFSKAINEFVKEFECVQKNTTLKLICDEFILTFVSGEGKNVAIVKYDDDKKKPKYEMKARGWIRFWRFLWLILFEIGEWNDILSSACDAFTSLLRSIIDWFQSWQKYRKMQ